MNNATTHGNTNTAAFLYQLESFLTERLLTDPADCTAYGFDNSTLQGHPFAVALPESHDEVVAIVQACNTHAVHLITRGQGTGTTGATVPQDSNTLVMSTQNMQKIIEVKPEDRLMVVEPGVTNQDVQNAAGAHGFFWPPDPTSAAICTIGGNLAYNSAGPRAVKYGTPRENTLALTAVTGSGQTIHTGTRTTKGVVGYDLTRLLIGSEGTIAVITEATLKLTPVQPGRRTLRASYRDMHSAAAAVSNIMAQPVTPCALEFMDHSALNLIRNNISPGLHANAGALLMIEIDGIESQLDELVQELSRAAEVDGILDIKLAGTQKEVTELWAARKALSPALRRIAPKKINEDVVVPVSQMPILVEQLSILAKKYQIQIASFGHAGNGNLHVNLMYDPNNGDQQKHAHACLEDLFDIVLSLQGSISGEHGIGLVKRDWVAKELDANSLQLMQAIRGLFDPNGILNPGKTLP